MQDNRSDRVFALSLAVLVWALLILGRLFFLQVVAHEELARQARQQQRDYVEVVGKRGIIYDRNMQELAISVDVNSVYANPRQIVDPEGAARKLSEALGLDENDLLRRLTSARAFVWVKRKVPYKEEEKVRSLGLRGVYFLREEKRFYPNRELGAHLIGFVGLDDHGLSGLEFFYDAVLRGMPGIMVVEQDARRKLYSTRMERQPIPGSSLVLTIDKTVQYIAEQELAAAVERNRAKAGNIIVMDPNTGQILAMASYPTFNPNRFESYGPEAWRNRAIADAYEPGSTFKVLVAAAALQQKLARPDELIDCQMGSIVVGGHTFHDHRRFGVLNVSQIIEKSSNVGAIKLGMRLGEQRLFEFIRAFGLGQKTGVDLPGEHQGLVNNPQNWSKISIGAIPFGQEIGATSLQVLRAVCAIANGGYLVRPYLAQKILSPAAEGQGAKAERLIAHADRKRIISEDTAEQVAAMMAGVVRSGTGRAAALDGYSAAGKTGTAQKIINGVYSTTKFVASFVGFAPANDPAIAAIVVIDEPAAGAYHGGEVAAPVFKRVVERTLIHLGVPKEEAARPSRGRLLVEQRSLQDYAPSQPQRVNRRGTVGAGGLDEEESELIVISAEGGSLRMPDLRGKSLRAVAWDCAVLGLELRFSGSGMAMEQIPPPGAAIFPGSPCYVWFSRNGGRQTAGK